MPCRRLTRHFHAWSAPLYPHERGVENLTQACGTGAFASALAWHHMDGSDGESHSTNVQASGGELTIHYSFQPETGIYHSVALEGPAFTVFEGNWDEPAVG